MYKVKGHACRQAGFTLMELLVVIALIMILSTVGVGTYIQATVKSKDSQRKSDLNQMSKAVESFFNDIGRYPLSTDTEKTLHCYVKIDNVVTNPKCDNGELYSQIDSVLTNYINIPNDPEPSQKYVYISDGYTYAFYTALENKGDRDLLKDAGGNVITDPWGESCGSVSCNYKVTETGLVKSL